MKRTTPNTTDRRDVLVGGAALVAGSLLPQLAAGQTTTIRNQENAAMPAPEYAIFTEFSPQTKPMKPGWNARVFTDTDAQKGNAIQCDFATGIVTLAAGTYHITALSMVSYSADGQPPETTAIRAPASAGYCRLRAVNLNVVVDQTLRGIENADPSIISIGSPSTANLTPSLLEAYYATDKPAQILLEHQSGSNPEQIYLRVFAQNSKWHVFARISIRRL